MARTKKESDNIPDDNYDNETEGGYEGVDDFNIEEDFQPIPLIAEGYCNGAVTNVKFNSMDKTIDWSVTLSDNGGVMSDGETPIDGSVHLYRNWLPKPGDEVEMTKKGTQTKRQAKINMMHDFAEGMNISMTTPKQILEAIANSDWIGIAVQVKMEVRTWEGRTFNNIARMVTV